MWSATYRVGEKPYRRTARDFVHGRSRTSGKKGNPRDFIGLDCTRCYPLLPSFDLFGSPLVLFCLLSSSSALNALPVRTQMR